MAKTNYNKMAKKSENITEAPIVEEAVVETAVEVDEIPAPVVEETTEIPTIKCGVVANCILLNIRKAPNTSAKILGTLSVGDEVVIHEEVGEFYKIGNPDGNEYCMKKFISVK